MMKVMSQVVTGSITTPGVKLGAAINFELLSYEVNFRTFVSDFV
jgi:hypothetical protein